MNTTAPNAFIHRFEPASQPGRPPIPAAARRRRRERLLLFGRMVAPGSALLSPRGEVLRTACRACRRLAEACSTKGRAAALTSWPISSTRRARFIALCPRGGGLPNGANIAAAVLLRG
jgi:phospholipase/carboxylesterase